MNPRTRNLLLLLLSVAAGCVDAIAFINTGVFPANMTGNSVVLASTLLRPSAAVTGLSALALLGFCIGAAVGALLSRSHDHQWSRRVSAALFVAGLLVSASALVIALTGGQLLPFVIVATAAAMGIQSAAVQHLGVAGVATVFVTGTLTTAVTRMVGAATSSRNNVEESPWLPALTWLSYFAGAVIGGLHRVLHLNLLFALPGIILLSVAAFSAIRPRVVR